jgi:hypothetical protein
MTAEQAKDKFNNNDVLDTLKQLYDEFRDITDPILNKQKLEFDLFYNDDLKYRKICLEIEEQTKTQIENLSKSDFRQYLTENNEIHSTIKKGIEERERFNITLHRKERINQINTFPTWINLFIGEKVPIQQSATMFKLNKDLLKGQVISLQSDISIDNQRIINDLSEEEEMVFNFNMERPFKKYWTEQRKEILKPFKSKFKGIPIDLELMNTLQKRKPLNTKPDISNSDLPNMTDIKGFDNAKLNQIMNNDMIESFLKHEERLKADEFITPENKWVNGRGKNQTKTLKDLVNLILLLKEKKYFKTKFDKKNLKESDYKKFFEVRYDCNLKDQFNEGVKDKTKSLETAKITFSYF